MTNDTDCVYDVLFSALLGVDCQKYKYKMQIIVFATTSTPVVVIFVLQHVLPERNSKNYRMEAHVTIIAIPIAISRSKIRQGRLLYQPSEKQPFSLKILY